jgi:hypothetical protein
VSGVWTIVSVLPEGGVRRPGLIRHPVALDILRPGSIIRAERHPNEIESFVPVADEGNLTAVRG